MTGLTRFFVLCILPPALGFTLPEHGMMTAMMRQQAAAEANPEAFLGSFLSGRGLEASLQALRESPSRSCVRSGGTGVLSSGEIEALRRHCDRSILCASSPTGDDCVVVNDITGTRQDLQRLLCAATIRRLCALPHLLGLRDDEEEEEEEELEVASVLMRRYRSRLERSPTAAAAEAAAAAGVAAEEEAEAEAEELDLSFPFHTDDHSVTVNIALSSSPSHYTGGDLIALYGGACKHHRSRREGDVIVHRGAVAHAVSPVLSGTRYAMVIFFDSKEKRLEQLARRAPSSATAAGGEGATPADPRTAEHHAEHRYQPNARSPPGLLLRKGKKTKPAVVAWVAAERAARQAGGDARDGD